VDRLESNWKSLASLTAIGLVSAVTILLLGPALSGAWPPSALRDALLGQDFIGITYGIAIAFYFIVFERLRSVQQVALFIFVSTCAYPAAEFTAFALYDKFPGNHPASTNSQDLGVPLPIFFVAGFLGAFLVLFAALYLFCAHLKDLRVLKLALLGALAGGVLGMAGWWIGTLIFPSTPQPLLFLIWQPGVCLVLAALLALVRLPSISPTLAVPSAGVVLTYDSHHVDLTPPTPAPSKRTGFSWIAAVFFAGVLAFFLWDVARIVDQKHFEQELQSCKSAAPSLRDLPALVPTTAEQALILQPIGDVSPKTPFQGPDSVASGRVFGRSFSVWYSRPEERELHRDSLTILATVLQLPNAAWANYAAANTPCGMGSVHPKILQKFGQPVFVDNSTYDQVTRRRVFFWTSGSTLIKIRFDNPGPDEDSVEDRFLKPYLDKYPSST